MQSKHHDSGEDFATVQVANVGCLEIQNRFEQSATLNTSTNQETTAVLYAKRNRMSTKMRGLATCSILLHTHVCFFPLGPQTHPWPTCFSQWAFPLPSFFNGPKQKGMRMYEAKCLRQVCCCRSKSRQRSMSFPIVLF